MAYLVSQNFDVWFFHKLKSISNNRYPALRNLLSTTLSQFIDTFLVFVIAFYGVIDNWISVEVYRLMHDGKLPPRDDLSTKWIVAFLDKINDTEYGVELMNKRDDFGSLYITSKRMVYRHAEDILKEIT